MIPHLLSTAILVGGAIVVPDDPARLAAYEPDANYMADQGFEPNAGYVPTASFLANASFDAGALFDPMAGFRANEGLIRIEPPLELDGLGLIPLLAEDAGWFSALARARADGRVALLRVELDRMESSFPDRVRAERDVLARLESRARARREAAAARSAGDARATARAERRTLHEGTRLARAEALAKTLHARAAAAAATTPETRRLASIRHVLHSMTRAARD